MNRAIQYPGTETLKKWFYYSFAGFFVWTIIGDFVLLAIYEGRLVPDLPATVLEQVPLFTYLLGMLALELVVLAVSVVLANKIVTVWKRIVLYAIAFSALVFAYYQVAGMVGLFKAINS